MCAGEGLEEEVRVLLRRGVVKQLRISSNWRFALLLIHSGGPEVLLDVRECDETAQGARLLYLKCFHRFFQFNRCYEISCVEGLRGGCDIAWWFHMHGKPRGEPRVSTGPAAPRPPRRQEAGKA